MTTTSTIEGVGCCDDCGRPMRPHNAPARLYPAGSVPMRVPGQCQDCYKAAGAGHCHSCARPVRPPTTKIADYPGTILEVARGLCIRCYRYTRAHDGEMPAADDTRGLVQTYETLTPADDAWIKKWIAENRHKPEPEPEPEPKPKPEFATPNPWQCPDCSYQAITRYATNRRHIDLVRHHKNTHRHWGTIQ